MGYRPGGGGRADIGAVCPRVCDETLQAGTTKPPMRPAFSMNPAILLRTTASASIFDETCNLQASSENFWNVVARSINKPRAEVSVTASRRGYLCM